jgi:hypothetical protein
MSRSAVSDWAGAEHATRFDAGNPRRVTNAQVVASLDCTNAPPKAWRTGDE